MRTTLQPLLFPTKWPANSTVTTIALDPGHGGRDPGNQEGRRLEKTYALAWAKEVQRRLVHAGFKVVMTRETDRALDLDERPALAKRKKADLFLSLHFNAAPSAAREARGVEVYCLPPAGVAPTHANGERFDTRALAANRWDEHNLLLSYQLQKSLVRLPPVEDRGVRRARWAVLRGASMPAVLIEGGFMTDPQEAQRIYQPLYRAQLAQAVVDGVLAYKRLVERRTSPEPVLR